jgi:recombination associated protein RdgC
VIAVQGFRQPFKRVQVFKNVIVYRLGADWSATLAQVESALDSARFVECGPSQERSIGWIEPRGEAHGPLVEAVGGQWILKLMIEAKVVPASVLNRKVKDQVDHIETTTGRKPGKKEKRDIKEDLKLSLLPMAFSKQAAVTVWIDPSARLLVLDVGSQAKADEVVTALVKSLDGFAPTLLNTLTSPTVAMSGWLVSQEPPAGFTVDRECELKATDESKAVVRYARHPLDNDEVVAHVQGGKQASKLALTWDSRVSFMLTESLQIKKIAFLDVVMDGVSDRKNEGFDTDVVLATGELGRLIPDLVAALGGELPTNLGPDPGRQ